MMQALHRGESAVTPGTCIVRAGVRANPCSLGRRLPCAAPALYSAGAGWGVSAGGLRPRSCPAGRAGLSRLPSSRPDCMPVAAYLAPGACWQPPSIYWTVVYNARSPASRPLPPIPCRTGQRSGRGGVAKRRPPEHRSVDNLSHTTAMTRPPTARRRRRPARPQADQWQAAGVLPEGSAGPQLCGRRRAQVRDASLEKLPAADWLLPSTSCAAPGAVSLGQWARPCCPQPTP